MSIPVKKVVLDGSTSDCSGPVRRAPGWLEGISWLVAPLMLTTLLGTLFLLRHGPSQVFTVLIAVVCCLPVLWVLISIFSPAIADRSCPECGELALEPMHDGALRGLRCKECGYLDPDTSAWKFAEEGDRPLEPLVMKSRASSALYPDTGSNHGGSS